MTASTTVARLARAALLALLAGLAFGAGLRDAIRCGPGYELDACWACSPTGSNGTACAGCDGARRSCVALFDGLRGSAAYVDEWTEGLPDAYADPLSGLAYLGIDGAYRVLLVAANGSRTDSFSASPEGVRLWGDGAGDAWELLFPGESLLHASGEARLEAHVEARAPPSEAASAAAAGERPRAEWVVRCPLADDIVVSVPPQSIVSLGPESLSVWNAEAGREERRGTLPLAWSPRAGCSYALRLRGARAYAVRHLLVDDRSDKRGADECGRCGGDGSGCADCFVGLRAGFRDACGVCAPSGAPRPARCPSRGAVVAFRTTRYGLSAAARALSAAVGGEQRGLSVAWEEAPRRGGSAGDPLEAAAVYLWTESSDQAPAREAARALVRNLASGWRALADGPVYAAVVPDGGGLPTDPRSQNAASEDARAVSLLPILLSISAGILFLVASTAAFAVWAAPADVPPAAEGSGGDPAAAVAGAPAARRPMRRLIWARRG